MIDNKDLLILKLMSENPAVSMEDLKGAILCHSVATVHNRIKAMEGEGYIDPPPRPKMARSRRVTEKGKQLLQANRM